MMSARLTNRWPRIRTRRDGVRIVSGWHTVQWRFALLHGLCRVLVMLLALTLLVVSVLPYAAHVMNVIPEGTSAYGYASRLIRLLGELRQGSTQAIVDLAPGLAKELWIGPASAFIWPFAIAGVIIYRLERGLAGPIARLLGLLAPVAVKRPFKVRIDSQFVKYRRWCIPWRYKRLPGVQLQFMAEQNRPGKPETYRAVMRYGHRTLTIARSMHERDARHLALGLSHARDQVDGTIGSVDPTLDMPFAM